MTTEVDPAANAEDLAALDRWEAKQSSPPTLSDVLETHDGRLIGAYILRGFRIAAADAVESYERVKRVKSMVLEKYDGDAKKAERFLCRRWIGLGRQTALQKTAESESGADEVIRLIGQLVSE